MLLHHEACTVCERLPGERASHCRVKDQNSTLNESSPHHEDVLQDSMNKKEDMPRLLYLVTLLIYAHQPKIFAEDPWRRIQCLCLGLFDAVGISIQTQKENIDTVRTQ